MTVAAVYEEVKGCFVLTPKVCLRPYLPPLYHCGDNTCVGEIIAKCHAHDRWRAGLTSTFVKLRPNRCDTCFKLTEEVHRSS